jgi:acyl carrier protein
MPDTDGSPQLDTEDDIAALTERIVIIWRSVFEQADITADSHLMDLGANSLVAVKIRTWIRLEFGRELDLIELLDHPTPRELAPVVAAAEKWDGSEPWDDFMP